MQIDVVNCSHNFGHRAVFDSVSCTFLSGSITALVGPSGSGKTTLLALVGGYLRPQSGRILWRTGDVERAPLPDEACWVPQGSNALPSRCVLDNVMIGPLGAGQERKVALDAAWSALAQVGLDMKAQQRANTLSGGELQRVCVARALASPLPVILLDEPSSNLDSQSTEELAEILRRLDTERLIIVATHDPILIGAASAVVPLRPQEERAA